ncbi:HpcH/HpaI aldolase/citrate lyase family protein [Halorarius litoreus]|uniref:HpcH/HpaI aldolase/citrate lyase family protein n=1 Tax=Halorarius litoreus TaxID=2962676 RepID=UPI0020CD73D1|nr:CoA ester lyase [Halorarius litoreus]
MYPARSLLYVPAGNRKWVENTPFETDADGVIFDLEDGTVPQDKQKARELVREALPELDQTDTHITARVNAPETGWFEDDIAEILHPNLDALVLPKVDSEAYVEYVDNAVTYVERRRGLEEGHTKLFLLPESAYGLYNPYEICTASDRVASITGGTTNDGDFNRALGYEFTTEGLESLYARSNVLAGAKAAGLEQIISGVWTDIDDVEGLREHAEFARQLGYGGYEIIHPSHASVVNDVFTPDAEEMREIQAMVDEIEDAFEAGKSIIRWNGEMIDRAHFRTAKKKLERAKMYGVLD